MPKSLLLIGFFDSPHFARWIENVLESTDYEMTIFCSSPARRINPYLQRLISENESRLRISNHSPRNPFFAYLIDKMLLANQRSRALRREIGNGHDVIHYFEMQHSGYLLLPLLHELRDEQVVYSNYGSDIFWFKRYRSHRRKMQKLLSATNLVFFECERDLDFLRNYCPKTTEYVWVVNSGGIRTQKAPKSPPPRNLISVKGYSNRWGQALKSLWMITKARTIIKENGLKIVVYSADLHVPIFAKLFALIGDLEIESHVKGALLNHHVLEIMQRSLIHVAFSKSDGIPSSTLEAMSAGAVPIQSSSACMSSLIKNYKNGFLLESEVSDLGEIFEIVLGTDGFYESAAKINKHLIHTSFSSTKIGALAAVSYAKVLS